jgi:hypothetical protein
MKKPIQVWMPEAGMENQREQEDYEALTAALKAERVYVCDPLDPDPAGDYDMAFIGSWRFYPQSREFRRLHPGKPVVQYNWDIYPFQVNEKTDPRRDRTGRARPTANATRWGEYLQELRYATEVWVPSQGVVDRTHQFAGRRVKCHVVKCNAYLWELEDRLTDWWQVNNVDLSKPYVVDVMREYTGEPMVGAVREVCEQLGIPCVQTNHKLTFDEFRCTIAKASLLVSAYNEASTGGLTLLEGYALGVPVLISDSHYQGANDYFGDRAYRFRAGDKEDLSLMIRAAMGVLPGGPISGKSCIYLHGSPRAWVEENYGTVPFAKRLAAGFRRVLSERA